MIVAIEGQVGAGKTTFTRLLDARFRVEPEYSPAPHILDSQDPWDLQLHFLNGERERKLRLPANADAGEGVWIVLDRSILSQTAHIYALASLGLSDSRSLLMTYLDENRQAIIEPHWFIHIDPPYTVRRAQTLSRETGPGKLGTTELFRDPDYEKAVDEFVRAFMSRIGTAVSIHGFDSQDTIWAVRLLESLAQQTKPIPETCRVLRDLIMDSCVGNGQLV